MLLQLATSVVNWECSQMPTPFSPETLEGAFLSSLCVGVGSSQPSHGMLEVTLRVAYRIAVHSRGHGLWGLLRKPS